jgi:hypothetical protein
MRASQTYSIMFRGMRKDPSPSGRHIGDEADIRVRYAPDRRSEITVGYSHFKAGTFTKQNLWSSPEHPNQRGNSNFLYLEVNRRFF